MKSRLLKLVKRLPVDLAQGKYRHTTRAKQIAFSLAGSGHGQKALDLGCGDGFWAKKLATRGWEVVAADYQPTYPGALSVNAEHALPFSSNTFDLIWLAEVLEHVQNTQNFLKEMRRVVKPNGRLIITTPNSAFWLYQLTGLWGITPAQIQNPDHKHFFSLADIKQLFPSASVYGFFPYNLIKFRIKHAIGPLSPTFIIEEKGKLVSL